MHIYHVSCDECGLNGYIIAHNKEYAKKRFEELGWKKIGDKNYCDDCFKNVKLKGGKFETEFYIRIDGGEWGRLDGVKNWKDIKIL